MKFYKINKIIIFQLNNNRFFNKTYDFYSKSKKKEKRKMFEKVLKSTEIQ